MRKFVRRHVRGWLSDRSRHGKSQRGDRCRRDGRLLGHMGHHFGVGGEHEIVLVLSVEIWMEMKTVAHDNDLDNSLVATKSFFESLFDVRLGAEWNSLTRIVRAELVTKFVHDGGNASRLAVAEIEKLLDLVVDHGEKLRIEDGSGLIEEIITVVGVVRCARLQQKVGEGEGDVADGRAINGRSSQHVVAVLGGVCS